MVLDLKGDFPIFENNPGLVYLDNAATSQKPKRVIEAMDEFQEKDNSNVGRGLYDLSFRAMEKFDGARKKIADFIGVGENEIIFTKNTTESLNLLGYTIDSIIPEGRDEILISSMEHHSNIVPWQEFAKRNNMRLRFIGIKDDFSLDYEDFKSKVGLKTAIVSICHVSNVLGTINDVKEISRISKDNGALVIIDAAQSVGHMQIDVKDIGCDFLVFSSHKILGPTGIGILFGRKELLGRLRPFQFGGGMIREVDFEKSSWADIPEKFEAGTQNIMEAIGFAESINYLNGIGIENVEGHVRELTRYAFEKLKEIKSVKIYSSSDGIGIVSFNLEGIHSHDVASLVNDDSIAIRAGHHCAMPLMKTLGIEGTCRASFHVYNDFSDVDKLIDSLKKSLEVFKK
jgi:cysteine desulfurase/selenocysteine lyase